MKSKKICVVGGGLGGMVAAYTLMEKGHDVTVFERGRKIGFTNGKPINPPQFDGGIGGKCFSPTINGQVYEMGACSCAPGFSTIISLARKTNARFLKRMPFKVVDIGGKRRTFKQCYWPKGATIEIFREIMIYLFHVRKFAKTCDKKTGYGNIPECWRISFKDFCYEHRLIHIPGWLELPVVSFGYGDLGEIETWFVFTYITATNLLGIAFMLVLGGITPVKKLEKGYQDLIKRLAAEIKVKTEHEVVGIDRKQKIKVTVRQVRQRNDEPDNINTGNTVKIIRFDNFGEIDTRNSNQGNVDNEKDQNKLVENDQSKVIEYDQGKVIEYDQSKVIEYDQSKVIEYDQRKVIEYDQSKVIEYDQRKVIEYDQRKVIEYEFDALVLSVPLPQLQGVLDFNETEQKLARQIYFNPYTIVACEIKGVDNECLLMRHLVHDPGHLALIEETVTGTAGFCVCYIPEKDKNRSNDEIISGLDQDLKQINATLIKAHTIKKWDYFPRFKNADLYQVLQQLQGHQNTWYVGATAKFELSEPVAAHARGLMDKAFDGTLKKEFFAYLRNIWHFYR